MSVAVSTPVARASVVSSRVFRASRWDALLLGATLLQSVALVALLALASAGGIALRVATVVAFAFCICWTSNTVSHNHLHNPLFVARWHNIAFSLWLTMLLAVPQTIWRQRHLWHHAGEPATGPRHSLGALGLAELGLVIAQCLALAILAPTLFVTVYLPGYLLGLALCQLQGHYEHAKTSDIRLDEAERSESLGVDGVSHYGRLHNLLWFNDGYHAEHHRHPRAHWRELPRYRTERQPGHVSTWAPLWRFAEAIRPWLNRVQGRALVALERLALALAPLQKLMLRCHERAVARLLPHLPQTPQRVAIVGGGLFPRTLLVLQRLLPEAQLEVIEASSANIACARRYLGARGQSIRFIEDRYDPARHTGHDLLVIPLGYVGDRQTLYRDSGTPALIHDWLWNRQGAVGTRISVWLLKRLNLRL